MNAAEPDRKTLLAIYQKMALIKHSDDRVIGAMKAGRMQMPYYSARGQECIPAAISVLLNDEDYLVTIYRGVNDMLAKGLPAKLLWAELAGKAPGSRSEEHTADLPSRQCSSYAVVSLITNKRPQYYTGKIYVRNT